MKNQCILEIQDEVNIKFHNLDPATRRKIVDKLSFFNHKNRYLPSVRLGRWNGKVAYATLAGSTYLNLLDRIYPIVEQNYDIEIVDNRASYSFEFDKIDENYWNDKGKVWPEGHRFAGQPVILEDYQYDSVNEFLADSQSIKCISTGAGKTLLVATLSHVVEKYGRSIVVVPSKNLVVQTHKQYVQLGLDVGMYFGDQKDIENTHIICTWQSLEAIRKSDKEDKTDLFGRLITGTVCVIIDEAHSAQASVLKNMLTDNMALIPLRIGLTGTIPKDDYNYVSLIASIGPVTGKVTAKELQDRGNLSNCHISVLQLKDDKEFPTYHEEKKYLVENTERITYLASKITDISLSGNTIVLFDNISTGELLKEYIESRGYKVTFVHGVTKLKNRQEAYDLVSTNDNEIIICTYGVAAVGIDIPRLFNVVLLHPGKSFVRTIQSIGRGLRKSNDKDFVNIYDVSSTCRFEKRHLTKRKEYYKEAEYPFKIEKVVWKK